MAFMEGKLQMIDLLGALQAKRGLQDDVESRKQKELQNRLMQEQLDAAEWQNLKDRTRPTMTVPSSGLSGMPHKIFLDEAAGYISGVSPTDTFNQWNQNFRQGMASGGGGGMAPQPTDAETRQANAVADITEEQARLAQQQRQGYGSATRDALAQQMIEAKMGRSNDAAYDDLIKGARNESRDRWADINAGDRMIANTKSIGNELQSELGETQRNEGAAQADKFKNMIYGNPLYVMADESVKAKASRELGRFINELAARKIEQPTDEMIERWLNSL